MNQARTVTATFNTAAPPPPPPPPPPSAQGSFYVATNGSDSNDGRAAGRPFRTIGRAVSAAQPGDTVIIRGGTYHEQLTLFRSGRQGAPIVFQGHPGETVIIDPQRRGGDGITITGNWISLRNVTVQNAGLRGIVIRAAQNVVIDGVTARYNRHTGIQDEGGANNLIQNCVAHNNHDPQNGGAHADGVQTLGTRNTTVRRCHAYNNSDDGFDAWNARGTVFEQLIANNNGYDTRGDGNGIKLSQLSDGRTTVRRSVAFNNKVRGIDGNSGSGHIVHNNSTFGNGWTGFADFRGSGYSIVNNINYDREQPRNYPGSRNNSWQLGISNPGYASTDPNSSQFMSLSASSPARGRGTSVPGINYSDLGAVPHGQTIWSLVR